MLTEPQIDRYARHILLREVGGVGQEKLLGARVHVSGLGPAGQWLACWLALAGVGRIDLADPAPVGPDDVVPLLRAGDVGRPRDQALVDALPAFNPDVRAAVAPAGEAGLRICADAADASALRIVAQGPDVAVIPPGAAACAHCLAALASGPPTPTAAARAGSLAAAEALQILLGSGPRAPRILADGEPVRCAHER